MQSIVERLEGGEVLVSDGAMGTMLFSRGLQPGECPESLNLEEQDMLEEIASLYVEAGADIINTNTFGGSPLKLAGYGLEDKTEEINSAAVSIAKRASSDNVFISGSCGPSGEILKPYGEAEPDIVYKSFERQIGSLVDAGVDIICVETMTDIREAELAIKAAKSVSSTIPVIATMTFGPTPRGFYTIMGISIEDAAVALEEAGADIVGSNCGNGIEQMVEIAKGFKEATDFPLIIQSNAGLPEINDGRLLYPESPDDLARGAAALLEVGVSVIGGCCGTTPEYVRAVREVVDRSGQHTIK